jgi:hypothetical protein
MKISHGSNFVTLRPTEILPQQILHIFEYIILGHLLSGASVASPCYYRL